MILLQHYRSRGKDSPEDPNLATGEELLSLTAADRQRSVGQGRSQTEQMYQWRLPRGTVLHPGDYLGTANGDQWVKVEAAAEPVLIVTSGDRLALLQAAYHLGNRHIPLEIQETSLRLTPDPVLEHLLRDHLHLTVTAALAPFFPESGAYHH